VRETKTRRYAERKLQLICKIKSRQRARRRRDDTRDRDGAIRAAVRNALAKTTARPRDNTSETIHEDEDRTVHDEKSWTIRDKVMISDVITLLIKQWAPGASNRTAIRDFNNFNNFDNLQITPAAPRSVYGRGA